MPYSHKLWAPELHYINGEWYIYFAGNTGVYQSHRMYALKGSSQDPTQPFGMIGKITDSSDMWAIDGTVLHHNGELYFIWSGAEKPSIAQNIYIAHMANPWTIDSPKIMLSKPEYKWEKITLPDLPYVNEAPAALYKNDTIHIVYSASLSMTDDYCLGLLTFRSGDIMNPQNWEKSSKPIFSQAEQAYGPGHCSFFKAENEEDWIIYHATSERSTGWSTRNTRIQSFTWDGDVPIFGTPVHPDIKLKIAVKDKPKEI